MHKQLVKDYTMPLNLLKKYLQEEPFSTFYFMFRGKFGPGCKIKFPAHKDYNFVNKAGFL